MSRLVPIGKVTSRVETWDPLSSTSDDPFHYIDISSVDRESKNVSATQLILPSDAPSRARQIVKTGDILVSTVRPNLNAVAEIPVYLDGATASTGYCVLRPDMEKIDSRYLFFWVRSSAFVNEMVKRATGASYPAVSDKIVKESKIPLPPLPEQKRIAAFLDKADSIRRKRQEAVRLTDELLRSVFLDMFGDPVTNPKGWETFTLNELGAGPGSIVDGPFGSAISVNDDYIEGGEIPVIRTKNVRPFAFITDDLKRISRDKFCGLERSSVIPGDIILTKVGTIGNVCIFPNDFEVAVLSTTGSCRIRPNKDIVRTQYLAHYLHHYRSEMMKLVAQGVQPFLNMSHIKSFKITIPPLELQDKFASRVAVTDKIVTKHKNSTMTMDTLFNTLLHRAFMEKP